MSLMLNTGAMCYREDGSSGWTPLTLVANVDLASLADEFSTSSTYAVGEYVRRNARMYRCTTAVTTAGAWNASNWTEVNIGDELDAIGGGAIIRPNAVNDFTDRRDEIIAKLNTYGYCEFLIGNYYISAPINLLEGQTIKGAGRLSVIQRTPSSTTYGLFYINNNANHITIKDIQLKGSLSSKPSSYVVSQEYGLSIAGDGSGVVVDNCYFKGFTSYGIYSVSGYACQTSSGIQISNCTFKFCGAGILFGTHGEYSDVSNCVFAQNYHGALVVGGNNKFANCGFDGNSSGFTLWDDHDTPSNDGHGSAVSCTFNHNTTRAVAVENIDFGYAFVGCNIYYGDVNISNSKGILFSNCTCLGHKSDSQHTDFNVTDCPGYISVDHLTSTYSMTFNVSDSPYFTKTNCRTHSGPLSTAMALTKNYTQNNYVTSAYWNDAFYQYGNLIICNINLNVASSPGSTFRDIGSVTLPHNLAEMVSCSLASQSNVGTLLWTLNTNGTIQIYSVGTATGWYRGTVIAILA